MTLTSRGVGRVAATLILTLGAGCELPPKLDFERMVVQHKYSTWQASRFFSDGRSMRTPPDGTVPVDADARAEGFGAVGGVYLENIPVPVTRTLLDEGHQRFDIYCAPCHGIRGDGVSRVARRMDLRRPPPLVGPQGGGLPPGRVYQVVTEGYGMMRSYSEDLISPEERWSVVAYLQALELSSGVPLRDLPLELRIEAEKSLR